jgi:hypothetical protein
LSKLTSVFNFPGQIADMYDMFSFKRPQEQININLTIKTGKKKNLLLENSQLSSKDHVLPVTKSSQNKHLLQNNENGPTIYLKINSTSNICKLTVRLNSKKKIEKPKSNSF